MRKLLLFIILIFLGSFVGCGLSPKTFSITDPNLIALNIGEETSLPYTGDLELTIWENSDPDVVSQEGEKITALSVGLAVIKATKDGKSKEYFIVVKDEVLSINIEGAMNVLVGEKTLLQAHIFPLQLNQEVLWSSNDPTLATVSQEGEVLGLREGFTIISATSIHDPSKQKEYPLIVYQSYDSPYIGDIVMRLLSEPNFLDAPSFMNLLAPLIRVSEEVIIGVNNYKLTGKSSSLQYSGSGVIYRRDIVLKNGEVITEYSDISAYDIKEFNYYVMTNRHVVKGANDLAIYYNSDEKEIKASLCAYDPQVDFAIITFTSKLYFPIARLGDSDQLQTGEFVYTIGNPKSAQYFRSASLGIVSYPKRYVSDDTDGDEVSDWHSEYIQHDAAINPGNSGGGLFNLKGELVGINTTKIVDSKVDNMGFAVPINLGKSLSPLLEEGIQPTRAKLGITVVDIKSILYNPSAFPEVIIPPEIKNGLYVNKIDAGGLGEAAGLQAEDIIISFDGVMINQTYMFRIVLVRHDLGSGDVVPMIINRQGIEMTIYVTF